MNRLPRHYVIILVVFWGLWVAMVLALHYVFRLENQGSIDATSSILGLFLSLGALLRQRDGTEEPVTGPLGRLVVTDGPARRRQFDLRQKQTIGRNCGDLLIPEDKMISSQHARIERIDGHWYITDLGSYNYTLIDGRKLEPKIPSQVRYGSDIRMGMSHFRLESYD